MPLFSEKLKSFAMFTYKNCQKQDTVHYNKKNLKLSFSDVSRDNKVHYVFLVLLKNVYHFQACEEYYIRHINKFI